ncbi:DUF4810 domain-containing protein [Campylobacter hominis]|uniref:DUF4810 domain-containing protein n=1 Tax=Campylobacter hominis TaxID=76517 RepID=UPI00248D0FC6|nr:DUF4810 domain-containing protein [Campylobacter hominis]
MKKLFLVIFAVIFMAGCAGNSRQAMYYHGDFNRVLYEYFNETGDINEQIADLENVVQKAYEKNMPVAPGIYAHLGLLYNNIGNLQKSDFYFTKEVENYPESANFVTFLKNHKNQKRNRK